MKVLFACRMFDQVAGGVERAATTLMNELVARGHDVSLFTWDRAGARAYYPLADSVLWHRLDMGDAARPAGPLLRARRMHAFRTRVASPRPSVVVAFQHGPFLFAATSLAGSGVPVILAERNAPHRFDLSRERRRKGVNFASMRLATAITVQFPSYVEHYPAYLRERIVVIPNPVYPAHAFASPDGDKPERTLLAVGRLAFEKNLPVLLRAFAHVAGEFPDWRLRVVGEGEDRVALEQLAASLGVEKRVAFPGATRDVAAEYQKADLFCLSSRWEGFPNAVAEAMAHGLPAVGFRGCAGISDLIVPGRNGALADGNGDDRTLAAALVPLMRDGALRRRLGTEARRIVEDYPPEQTFDRWEKLLHDAARAQ